MEEQISLLIIDDEPVAREALESVLINQGYNLIFAYNGPEGLVKAREVLPDVVLLDIMMPGMNGFEVCKHLRQEPLLAEVPIILITALDDRSSRLQGLEAGADDFISKPFDRIELRTRVKSITRLNRYRNLLNERSKTSWIIDQAKDGYLLIDQNNNILYSNNSAGRYFTTPDVESLKGKNFLEQATINYNLVPESAWQDWPNSKVKHYLVKPETESANAVFLQVDTFSSTRSSQPHWLVSIRDVSENTHLQSDVWRFHSIVSHKLRTPLTVIMGSLKLLEEDLQTNKSAIELLDMAIKDTTQLYENIKEILSFITSPSIAIEGDHFQILYLPQIIEDISKNLSLSPISISGYQETSDIKLPLSEQAFSNIIRELLQNSQKFHLTQSPEIEIQIFKNNDKIILTVSDDGKHLPLDQLAQVWLPYYQAEKHLTGQISGMGLGLTMVTMLVWKVGGQCHIYNRIDKVGLTVKLVLPIVL